MTDSVRVLYLAPDRSTVDAVEPLLADERPELALSSVTSVEDAADALEGGGIDHVVVDAALVRETDDSADDPTTDLRATADVPVETVGVAPEVTEYERARVLARQIVDAATARSDGHFAGGAYFRAFAETVSDAIFVIDADSTIQFANPAVEEIFGYGPDELVGESLTRLMPEPLRDRHQAGIRRYLREGDRQLDWSYLELPGARRDGGEVPLGISFSEFVRDGEIFFTGIARDISDRKRREEKLTALHDLMQSLEDAEARQEICDLAADAAAETLGFENAVIALYDDEAGMLAPTAQRWAATPIDDALLGTGGEDVAWETFIEGETRVLDDLRESLDAEATMGSALAVPLGKHGVFIAAERESGAFDDADVSITDILCANVKSALDRGEREETLRDRRNAVQEKNRELERLNRLNRVIRGMTQALTSASTEEEILHAVCDRLAESGPYRFAWFGEYDRATDEVRPRTWAGVKDGYLQDVSITADESETEREPAGRAIRTREPQAEADLLGDPPFASWRQQALKRGYRSGVSVPVTYGDTLYGVLSLYAGETGVFDETEQSVLAELAETVGYALNAIERKQAFVSEQSVDLDFRVRDATDPVLSFVAETGGELEFENAVRRDDGHLHAFVALRGIDSDETMSLAEGLVRIENVRLVADRDDESLYECTLGDESLLSVLADRGVMPRTITATGGEARFVVRISRSADVRSIVELFEDGYDEVELVARRERDEPVRSRHQFESEFEERLTERQREVLELAYFSGFFEWPRESTAQDVAEMLDVSQPTVSRHVRSGERALFSLLFEDT